MSDAKFKKIDTPVEPTEARNEEDLKQFMMVYSNLIDPVSKTTFSELTIFKNSRFSVIDQIEFNSNFLAINHKISNSVTITKQLVICKNIKHQFLEENYQEKNENFGDQNNVSAGKTSSQNMFYALPVHYNSILYFNIHSYIHPTSEKMVNQLIIYDQDNHLKYYKIIEPSLAINVELLEKLKKADEDFKMEELELTFYSLNE